MKRIIFADDHEIVRSGIRAIVESHANWGVAGEAKDGEQAVALAIETKPDLAVIDYSMPLLNGIEVCRRLQTLHSRTKILILTMHDSDEILTDALLAGVDGLLLKSDAGKHLLYAIEALLDGRPYFTNAFLQKMITTYRVSIRKQLRRLLTSREQCVVKLIAEGHTNKSIGSMLHLSVKTVETHRAAAMRKLELSSTAELVRYAIRRRLVVL